MDSRKLQGWHADPFGLHEQRYFSVGTPTKLVRDGNVESHDEPPTDECSPEDVAVVASAALAASAAASASQPDSGHRDLVSLGRKPTLHPAPPARRRHTGLVYTSVALVAVIAVIVFVAVSGGFSSKGGSHADGSGLDLAALVTRSAQKTLAQKTAAVAIQGGYDFDGFQANVQGSGELDFAVDAWTMKLAITSAHFKLVDNEIVTGQNVYLQTAETVGRSRSQFPGGGRWFESPISDSTSQAASQDSPVSSLRLLEQDNARVVPMGAQNIGGLDCNEYTVTPATRGTPVTFSIWLDQQRHLTCQLYVYLQFSTAGMVEPGTAPSAATEQFLMTFTRYGVPVTITPPAQSDTVSFGAAVAS